MKASIRPLAEPDYSAWLELWNANNDGHTNDEVTAETWRRLIDPASSVHGLAAWRGEDMAGLVHYILHPVTGHINSACYMQDLFVSPSFRRHGIGRAIVLRLAEMAADAQWARLYWLAADNNEAAQALYRRLGLKLDFSFYIMPLK